MNAEQKKVFEFHKACNILTQSLPEIPDTDTCYLRCDLIREELKELEEAFFYKDIGEVADALGDLLYVVYGSAVSCGIDLEPIFNEIHRSNMTKIGGPVRADGKQLKPPTYDPPKIWPVLEKQQELI